MTKKEKKRKLNMEDETLKKLLKSYCKRHEGRFKKLHRLFRQMGIPIPNTLERFDGKETFFTKTGEQIRIKENCEDDIALVIVKKGNVEKLFECFFPESSAQLTCMEVVSEKETVSIFLGCEHSEMKPADATMEFMRTKEIVDYLKQLPDSAEPSEVVETICSMV